MVARPFMSVTALGTNLGTAWPVAVIDARAEQAFLDGHISGAVNLDARFINPVDGSARRLADPGALGRQLQQLGLSGGAAVIYGAHGGSDAAHAWWTLTAMGLRQCSILDGGIEAWTAGGLTVTAGPENPAPAESPPNFNPVPDYAMEMSEIRARLGDPDLCIVDTRAPEEFSGEDLLSERGGHIPGAHLVPWDDLLEGDPPVLQASRDLRTKLADAMAAREAVTYCQSGVRAAHTFAVLKMLGHPRPRMYLGSWEEWGNDGEVPIDKPQP